MIDSEEKYRLKADLEQAFPERHDIAPSGHVEHSTTIAPKSLEEVLERIIDAIPTED